MKAKKMLLIAVLAIFSLISCRKNTDDTASQTKQPSHPGNIDIIAACREVATILEEVYQDEGAYAEVNATIRCGYYEDERVLLHDLLAPQMSDLYRSQNFRRLRADTGRFRRAFCKILDRGNHPVLKRMPGLIFPASRRIAATVGLENNSFLSEDSLNPGLPGNTKLALYFPYSEQHMSGPSSPGIHLLTGKKTTIVGTDRDADIAPGREPYSCKGLQSTFCYRDVEVDDAFAAVKPVHIVAIGATPKPAPEPAVVKSGPVSRVYNGWSRLSAQMDRLISLTGNGGGSEIKIGRISGYLRITDQQVRGFTGDLVTVHFTRAEIRQNKWKRIFSIWDPNWNYQDTEQIYAVYEEDTQGEKTFTGNLSTMINFPGRPSPGKAQGELSYKISVVTQDEIITQRKYDRKSFFADGLLSQGWGFVNDPNDFLPVGKDWPVTDGGTVWSYSLGYREY